MRNAQAWPEEGPCHAYLTAFAQLTGSVGGVGQFYLHFGHRFAPCLTASHGAEAPRQCYRNAALLALSNEQYIYCEGFACPPTGIPVHHAWCINAAGTVVDPTWLQADRSDYFGVPIRRRFLAQWTQGASVWGIFSEFIPPEVLKLHPAEWRQAIPRDAPGLHEKQPPWVERLLERS